MKSVSRVLAALLIVAVLGSVAAKLNAQGRTQPGGKKPAAASEQIPPAALLTERGRQLADELRLLQRSRDSMGAKHPTLPLINKKIEAVLEQLQAWEPAPNPFHAEESGPQMNEYDLRQVVIKLSKKVEELEKRVAKLESQAK